MPQRVVYFAESIFSDPTSVGLTVLGIIQLPEAAALMLESGWNPKWVNFLLAACLVVTRYYANRPVRLIAPGQVKPVEVTPLTATQPMTPPPRPEP